MGSRGPTPTPTPIKLDRGSWRGVSESKKCVTAQTGKPRCPAWLDPKAKQAWKAIIPELEKLGVIATCDGKALALLCEAFAEWKNAKEKVSKMGEVIPIKNPDGSLKYLQQNPYVSIARKSGSDLLRLLREFGLTPASRTRIEIATQNDQDESTTDPRYQLKFA